MVTINRIRADEGPLLRDLRVRALTDAPQAFGAKLADTLAQPDEEWARRATAAASDDRALTYWIARDAGRAVGLVGAFLDDGAGGLPHLISMWVDPGCRGCGIADGLVDEVVAWARTHDAAAVVLDVATANITARRLYERCGFTATGESAALESDPTADTIRMRRDLSRSTRT